MLFRRSGLFANNTRESEFFKERQNKGLRNPDFQMRDSNQTLETLSLAYFDVIPESVLKDLLDTTGASTEASRTGTRQCFHFMSDHHNSVIIY